MVIREFPKGWHGDALPSGEFVVTYFDNRDYLDTHLGPLTFPIKPLYPRIAPNEWKFAGQAGMSTAEYRGGQWNTIPTTAVGVSPVIYDGGGQLLISNGSVGSQGYRYVEQGTGRVVSGDESLLPKGEMRLFEWTDLGDGLFIGQGSTGGCIVWDGRYHRQLSNHAPMFIRANRQGEQVAIYYWVGSPLEKGFLFQTTMTELRNLPISAEEIVPEPGVGCFPRKMFMSPYETHSAQYGITPEFVGNVCFPDASVPAPAPFIQDVPSYRADRDNATLAVYVHASKLNTKPADYDAAIARDKPVILYLDSRLWPVSRPAWINTDRTWLGIQAYRGPLESPAAFHGAMSELLGRLSEWGLPFVLSVQAYDRNHQVGSQHAVTSLRIAEVLAEQFRVIGFQPFADMRPGGMHDHPAILMQVKKMFDRIPGRPNRYDYWYKDETSLDAKLSYDVPQFTAGERDLLRDALACVREG